MNSRGMTLLEVMVAMFIFAMAGSAILQASSAHLRNIGVLQDMTFATWVANNRLQQMQLETTWPPQNNKKGQQHMANRDWFWQQTVTETQDPDLRMVEITVAEDQAMQHPVTSVQSFFSKPAPVRMKAN